MFFLTAAFQLLPSFRNKTNGEVKVIFFYVKADIRGDSDILDNSLKSDILDIFIQINIGHFWKFI